jgi:hypothetical protein
MLLRNKEGVVLRNEHDRYTKLVFYHKYCAVRRLPITDRDRTASNYTARFFCYDVFSDCAKAAYPPTAKLEFAFTAAPSHSSRMPVYGLADTSSISCGAWIHQDYHDPTHFWLIKNAPPHDADGGGDNNMSVSDSDGEGDDGSSSSGGGTDEESGGSDTEEEADMAASYQS